VKGVVVNYDNVRRYGFIRSADFAEDVFFHANDVEGREEIRAGRLVSFDTKETPKGKAAINVLLGKQQASPASRFGWRAAGGVAAISAILIAGGLHWLAAYLVGVNAVTLLLYGYDKSIAGTGSLRVPENILHSLALCGGSVGALLGQKIFRHKTRKTWFQLVYWVIVAVQVALLLRL